MLCINFTRLGQTILKIGGLTMSKMTQEEAVKLASKIIKNAKKHGLPLKKKTEK